METKGLDQQENKFLSDFQLDRYSRQVILSEISESGQTKLLSSKVVIIGCGGLGCPLGLYLASAGIGSITLVDNEKVELSNLNRQIAFKFSDVDKYKSLALGKALKNINQEIEIKTETKRLSEHNISQIFFDKDIIVDCTDNYETRLLIAKNCFEAGIPMSFGAAVRQEGQTAFFRAKKQKNKLSQFPCYACLFPSQSNSKLTPRCSEVGILGPVTGIIASIQALNTIRYLTSQKVSNNLMLWDGLSFYEVKTDKRDGCIICG